MFLLEPTCKDYIWGGTLLVERFGKGNGMSVVAESWELSTHPNGLSRLAGEEGSLRDYLRSEPAAGGAFVTADGDLPILVKLIDARRPLSVQVHPDDAYAARVGQRGKTELWHVLDATPDAYLYLGVNRAVSREEFETRIQNNTVEEVLKKVPVKAGESYFIPSGMLHAIGAGCLIYEVQQSSNLTYRVYDYGRVGADGKPRQLHIQDALAVSRLMPVDTTPPGAGGDVIVSCPYFVLRDVRVSVGSVLCAPEDSFCHLLCVEGTAQAIQGDRRLSVSAGTSLFLGAGERLTLQGNGKFMAVSLSNTQKVSG